MTYSGECEDDFVLPMHHCSVLDVVLLQELGSGHSEFVTKKGLAVLELVGEGAGHNPLESLGRLGRDCEPVLKSQTMRNYSARMINLWSPVQQVVDRIEVHVLDVPREHCFVHSKVQKHRVHAFDSLNSTKKLIHS